MSYTSAHGKYVKVHRGLFSSTSVAYNGDGDPPPEFFAVEANLLWFQKPFGLVLIATISAVLGAAGAKWLGLT